MKWLWSAAILLGVILITVGFITRPQEANTHGTGNSLAGSGAPPHGPFNNVGGALRAAIVHPEQPAKPVLDAPNDPKEIVVSLGSIEAPPNSDSEEPEPLIRRWASENPSAAAVWAEKQVDPAMRQEALNQVALAWAERDLSEAIKWAASLPADGAQSVVLMNLGYEAARTQPLKALALASSLPPGRERDDLFVHAVSQWAGNDAQAATEWACNLSELALRERVLAAIATAMADQNPEAAVILATQAMWPGKFQNQAAVAIVQRWTQQDPLGAASWVKEFPQSANKDAAIGNLVAVSLDKDPEASSAWRSLGK